MKPTKRKITLPFGICVFALPMMPLQALELGDISVHSSLDEPFEASVELRALDGLEAPEIEARLPGEPAYGQAGIEYPPFVSGLDISVDVDETGQRGSLHIRSDDALEDPMVSLIVEVRGGDRRALRSYSLLLDFDGLVRAESEPLSLSDEVLAEPPPSESEATEMASDGEELAAEYRVEEGDTLWEIATQFRADDAVSVQQMMLALQRANPEAFMDGNINRLRSGAVLRLPEMRTARRIDAEEAVREVAEHNQRYEALVAGEPLAEAGAGRAGDEAASDELNIVTADGVPEGADADEVIAELERELMVAEESRDRAEMENQELRSRFTDLNDQIALLENIVAIEQARLAELQAELAAEEEAEAQAQARRAAENEADREDGEERDESAPAAGQEADGNRFVAWLGSHPLVFWGGLAGLVALLTGLLAYRRRRAEEARQAHESRLTDEALAVEAADDRAGPVDVEEEIEPDSDAAIHDYLDELDFTEDAMLDGDDDEDNDRGVDEQNQLHLAVAYQQMGKTEEALATLRQIIASGDEADKAEARELLDTWSDGRY